MTRSRTFDRSEKVPERLLEPMERFHLDKELIADFFFAFSRFEFALKQAGYLESIQAGADARPDWTCFSKRINAVCNFDESPELRKAVDYLLSDAKAPKKQVVQADGSLDWKTTPTGRKDIEWVLILVRRVRNNLFHGGKYTGSLSELARDTTLLKNSLIILDACLNWDDDVRACYFT